MKKFVKLYKRYIYGISDVDDCTPLLYAARLRAGSSWRFANESIMDILLDNGADPLVRSTDNKTPLDYAVASWDNNVMITTLLRHVASLEAMGDPRASEMVVRGIVNDNKRLQIYENCQCEIVSMKEEKIHGNASYFDMIKLDPDTLVRNDELVRAFENNQTIKTFGFYGKVKTAIEHALKKKDLTEMAIKYLYVVFGELQLPIPVLETIIKFYGWYDLETFVRLCQETEF